MITPPGFSPDSGSYVDLLKRMTQRVQQAKVDQQILELVTHISEKELDAENIVLSHPERVRLLHQVTIAVLTKMLDQLNTAK